MKCKINRLIKHHGSSLQVAIARIHLPVQLTYYLSAKDGGGCSHFVCLAVCPLMG